VKLAPTNQNGVSTRAAGGGGHSGDFTGDGIPDLLGRQNGTDLRVYPNSGTFNGMATYPTSTFINTGWHGFTWIGARGYWVLGYGWETIDRIVLTDVDGNGLTDILGRRAVDSTLLAYQHSGTWAPVDYLAYTTYRAPVVVGTNWWINDIIS
jgi:hypothetical protein